MKFGLGDLQTQDLDLLFVKQLCHVENKLCIIVLAAYHILDKLVFVDVFILRSGGDITCVDIFNVRNAVNYDTYRDLVEIRLR